MRWSLSVDAVERRLSDLLCLLHGGVRSLLVQRVDGFVTRSAHLSPFGLRIEARTRATVNRIATMMISVNAAAQARS